ncbi:MAG: MazG family protein [Clostridia bacterium]|nr:MazG family protein [Clostridia bacterium]
MNKQRVENLKSKSNYTVADLREIMEILRGEGGCPWDREQTHKSIRRNLIEETYEVIEGIDKNSDEVMCEELGDLLLQVVFHARIAEEADAFNLDDVADGICKKLILRHPHIFADVVADTSEEVLKNWDAIKQVEKHQKSDKEVLDAVSHSLPSLIRADKIGGKAAKQGRAIDTSALASLAAELSAAKSGDVGVHEKVGELLLQAAVLAKTLGVDGEQALGDACDRFIAAVEE